MTGRRLQRMLAAVAFAAAATCFALGLTGRLSPWMAALVVSLTLLTIGFYLGGAGSGRGGMDANDSVGPRSSAGSRSEVAGDHR